MAIVIASPRAESWGVAGVVRRGSALRLHLRQKQGKNKLYEPGDFPRSHKRVAVPGMCLGEGTIAAQ